MGIVDLNLIGTRKYLLKMTMPIFVEMFLAILVGNVDQFMIGRVSETGVAAIGNANQIINLLLLAFNIISLATTILVSQYLGAKRYDSLPQIYTLSITVNLVLSVTLSTLLIIFASPILTFMNVPETAFDEAYTYLTTVSVFLFTQGIYMAFSAIIRSNGLMRYTMYISAAMNVANLVVNLVLINGLFFFEPMGVMGAAIGTNVSRTVGVILIVLVFNKKISEKISIRCLKPFPTGILKKLLSIGLPSVGENISYNLSQLICITYINVFGAWVVSTRFYAVAFSQFSSVFISSIAASTQIIVGYYLGAKMHDDAIKRVRQSLHMSWGIAIVISSMLFAVSTFLFGFVTDNPEMISLGRTIMLIDIVTEIGRCINMIVIKSLQAAGDVRFPVVVGIIDMWVVSVLGGYILGSVLGLGLIGVWIAMTCDELIRGIIFVIRWKKGKWKKNVLVEETKRKEIEVVA